MKKFNKNYLFGIGTLGRDMVYAMSTMYIMYFLTDVVKISVKAVAIVTAIIMALRVFDAANDPFMGFIIDNTHTKYGKFKPWILGGTIMSSIMTILLFINYPVKESVYLVIFGFVYLFWGIAYTAHDISYYSMIPALSSDQHEREKIGSITRIFADIGLFATVVGIIPITKKLGEILGGEDKGYFALATICSVIMLLFVCLMCLIVKEDRSLDIKFQQTPLKEIFKVIFKNDQLMWAVISMCLFTIAYTTTTSFGLYYFEYIYGNKDMYSTFAIILAVSQLSALAIFPVLSKKFGRKKIYSLGTILVFLGYLVFFFAKTLPIIALGGVLIFVGEGFLQILMLMFISDCVEYGEWKNGKRNDSITISLQPFITKFGAAIASGIVGLTVVLVDLHDKTGPLDFSPKDTFVFKLGMLIIPLIAIIISFIIYKRKFIIDEEMFKKIQSELKERRNKN